MKKVIPAILAILLLVFVAYVMTTFQRENTGPQLAAAYFSATPVDGYGTQRALAPVGVANDDASILQQGIRYHQQADYDLALVSLRAYLEDHSVTEDYLPSYLASTAAFATGRYSESREYVEGMEINSESAKAAFLWQSALLELREKNFRGARGHLEELKGMAPAGYASAELLSRLPESSSEGK